MKTSFNNTIWLAGIAIFSMFFGAGNVIFPLKVGLAAGQQIPYALAGLILTAIGGPMLGLVGATLYKGNCQAFFCRPGKTIGLIFIAISLFLLGPFAVIPRCFVVAYSSLDAIYEGINLFTFSLIIGALALICCLRQNLILPLLGRFFSPALLLSLICIIGFGIWTGFPLLHTESTPSQSFFMGIEEGYATMDLIAAIFFSSSIWSLLMLKLQSEEESKIAKIAIYSGLLGGSLLGLIYVGLGLAP